MALIPNIKEAASVIQKIGNLDLYRKLLDSQGEALDLMEQLQQKDKLIAELKKTLELKEKLRRFGSVYFNVDKDGEATGLPYCPKCFEVDGIACHMIYGVPTYYQFGCPTCKLSMGSSSIPRIGELKPEK